MYSDDQSTVEEIIIDKSRKQLVIHFVYSICLSTPSATQHIYMFAKVQLPIRPTTDVVLNLSHELKVSIHCFLTPNSFCN